MVISPHDPDTLYHGGERLFKTTDGGVHWETISPDLTRNDKSKQHLPGGEITLDDSGTEYYDTIFAVAESPITKGLIWVGTDDGLVQITRDEGKNWANITPKDLPEWSRISQIDASPHDAATAYVAVDRHQSDDLQPLHLQDERLWPELDETDQRNSRWFSFVRAVREDPKKRGLLYAGTENGVFVSFNDGADWRPLKLNLPTTPVHDLVVKDNDLVVATHGRPSGFWTTLARCGNSVIRSRRRMFISTPQRQRTGFRREQRASTIPSKRTGQNPPVGAVIYFFLKDAPKEGTETKLEILDASGKVIRKYSSTETQVARRTA